MPTKKPDCEKRSSTEEWRDRLEAAWKAMLILWVATLLVGGLIVILYGLSIGYLPAVKLENIVSSIFSLSLIGSFYVLFLTLIFVASPGLWRMSESGAMTLLPASVRPSAKVQPKRKDRPHDRLRAHLVALTFLAYYVLFDLVVLASVGLDRWLPESVGFREGTFPLMGLVFMAISFALPYVVTRWQDGYKRPLGEHIGRVLARTFALFAGLVPLLFLLSVPRYLADSSWWLALVAYQVFHSLSVEVLAAKKKTRRQDLGYFIGGIVVAGVIVLAAAGKEIVTLSMRQLGIGNLNSVALYLDSAGRGILAKHGFVKEIPEPEKKRGEAIHRIEGVDVVLALGDHYVLKMHDSSSVIRKCRFIERRKLSAEEWTDCLLLPAGHVRATGSVSNH